MRAGRGAAVGSRLEQLAQLGAPVAAAFLDDGRAHKVARRRARHETGALVVAGKPVAAGHQLLDAQFDQNGFDRNGIFRAAAVLRFRLV